MAFRESQGQRSGEGIAGGRGVDGLDAGLCATWPLEPSCIEPVGPLLSQLDDDASRAQGLQLCGRRRRPSQGR